MNNINQTLNDWSQLNVAVTGINVKPDNPGPGLAVARCIKEAPEFSGKVIGLGYDAFDPGLYHHQYCDNAYLIPYPSAGEQELIARLSHILLTQKIDVLIPCLDSELLSFARLEPQLNAMGITLFMPTSQQIQARNKDRLSELCEPLEVNTPKSKNITSSQFFYSKQEFGFPLVVEGSVLRCHHRL